MAVSGHSRTEDTETYAESFVARPRRLQDELEEAVYIVEKSQPVASPPAM